jgi:hypothetical protein
MEEGGGLFVVLRDVCDACPIRRPVSVPFSVAFGVAVCRNPQVRLDTRSGGVGSLPFLLYSEL